MYPALAILSLAFLIVVHEGGHYFVARWCGMRIDRFSIGFGPGILKRVSKKTGTTFQLAPIPFGGFVEIRGMNIAEEVDPDDRFAYPNRPAWQRFITIFAGPATNYISAIVVAFALFTCAGVRSEYRFFGVGDISPGYDANGKLKVGDRILAVDHKPIMAIGQWIDPKDGTVYRHDDRDSLRARVNSTPDDVVITVQRDGKKLDYVIHPQIARDAYGMLAFEEVPFVPCYGWSEDKADAMEHWIPRSSFDCTETFHGTTTDGKPYSHHYLRPFRILGISPTSDADFIHTGVIDSAGKALTFPIVQTKMIASGLYGIVFGDEKADPGGPKRIYDEFSKAWKIGWRSGIELLMGLSIYLGLFNLFPLPALDGGRLVFLGYEMVTRRRANPRIEAMVHMGGIMVLGVIMILVTLRDCGVLFS
ncbi:MAG TPA: M50 family metallopeptidase [Kofleriaceae bacterium]